MQQTLTSRHTRTTSELMHTNPAHASVYTQLRAALRHPASNPGYHRLSKKMEYKNRDFLNTNSYLSPTTQGLDVIIVKLEVSHVIALPPITFLWIKLFGMP